MNYLFSLPVWGQHHIDLFLKVGLPSLLSPGNLPALDLSESTLVIHTEHDDLGQIHAGELDALTRRFGRVIFEQIEGGPDKYAVMTAAHRDAITYAEPDMALVFPLADHVWADGALKRMNQIAEKEYTVIHLPCIRMNMTNVVPWLAAGTPVLSPRLLVGIGLKNLHPVAFAHMWSDRDDSCGHPSNLYWRVGGGLLAHAFHMHPLMVRPERKAEWLSTIDDDFILASCPDLARHYVVQDSDDICVLELSPPDEPQVLFEKRCNVDGVRGWMLHSANALHRQLARLPVRFHTQDIDLAEWEPVEAKARAVLDEIFRLDKVGVSLSSESDGKGGKLFVCTNGLVSARAETIALLVEAINAEERFQFRATLLTSEELELNAR